MHLKQWLDKRLGGCVPARSWRRKKKPTQHHHHHNTPHFEIRLSRRWVFERPSSSSSSTHSTDPLTTPITTAPAIVAVVLPSLPPPSPRSCSLPPNREVTKLRKVKSTASIPKQVIRKLSVTPPRAQPVVAAATAAAAEEEEKVEEEGEEEEEEREEETGEEREEEEIREQEPVKRRFFAQVDPSEYEGIRERVADHLPEATVVYTDGGPAEEEEEAEEEGEEEEGEERRVDEDTVQSVIVQQTAVESSIPSEFQQTVSSVIVPSTAVEVEEEEEYVEEEEEEAEEEEVEEEEEEERESPRVLLPTRNRPRSPHPSALRSRKTITTTTQLPTPSASASEQDQDSDNDSGFTPSPPDIVDEEADRARMQEICGLALQREEDEDKPGPGALLISTYPYTRPTRVLTENHRFNQPKSSILKPFDPPLIFADTDMSTAPDTTKPGDVAVAPASIPASTPVTATAKGKKAAAAADNKAAGAQAATGEKKLTGKELKEAKKAEKQARRAADKAQRDVPDAATASSSGAPTKQVQLPTSPGNQSSSSRQAQQNQQGQKGKQQQAPSTDGDARTFGDYEYKHIPFFDHLRENKPAFDLAKINRDVHPSVLRLSMKLRNFEIMGSTSRCLYMLLAFKETISDYYTPEGAALSRNLTQHLNLQISQIALGRKLSVSQGNAIRWLKTTVSRIPPEIPDDEAKADIIASIDTYMKERILVAQDVIANVASEKISNGDVILTYAKSSCVERVLRRALVDGKQFSVVIIDSRPHFEGRGLAKSLIRAGIQVKYTTLHALDHVMKKVNKVFLGAHAVYANGACYSRAGTSAVAMTAAEYGKPVMICCEGLKLSDKIVMDSITTNELGPTEALIGDDSPLQNHAEIPNLHIVNILYDLTLPKYITAVITETGFTPPFGIPSVFRLLAEREGTVGAS